MDLEKRFLQGDKRALARLISLAENKDTKAFEIIKNIYYKSGKARVIGITGPPGAGKSTLTDKLVKEIRNENKKVAIIAVDPTSSFTGGAILGDRVRMGDLNTDSGVFIRSMATRGHLGGISEATGIATKLLDIFGYDYIFIETVGVGQSEIDIVKMCDTTIIVMVPGLGDDIQAIKAGIMEIGDIFAINKADRDGAKRTAREIEMMLDFKKENWRPPVELVVAIENQGIKELYSNIQKHLSFLNDNNLLLEKKIENAKCEITEIIKSKTLEKLLNKKYNKDKLHEYSVKVAEKLVDPYSASEELLKIIFNKEEN